MKFRILPALLLVSTISAPCLGEGFEIGDAIYNSFNIIGLNTGYDHAGLIYLAKPDFDDPLRQPIIYIYEAMKDDGVQERTLEEFDLEFGPYASTSSFEQRRSIISCAKACDGIEYIHAFGNSFDALLPYDDWDGTVPDIDKIRCDGLVEYCYNKAGVPAFYWYDADGGGTTYGIDSPLVLPFYNDLPPIYSPGDPCYFFPRSQRGAAGDCTGGGPGGNWEGSGTFLSPTYGDAGDTEITEIIVGHNGEDKILITATDPSSGISYIRYAIVPAEDLTYPPVPPGENWGTITSVENWDSMSGADLAVISSFVGPARWKGFYFFQAVDGAGNLSEMGVVSYDPLVPDGSHTVDDREIGGWTNDLHELRKGRYPEYDIYRDPERDGRQPGEFLGTVSAGNVVDLLQSLDATQSYTIIGKDIYGRERRGFHFRGAQAVRKPDPNPPRPAPDHIARVFEQRADFRDRFTGRDLPTIKTSEEAISNPEATDLIIYSSDSAALADADLAALMFSDNFDRTSQIVLGSNSSYQECRAVAEAVFNECLATGFGRLPILIIAGTFDRFGSENNLVSAVPYNSGGDYSDNLIVDFDGDGIPDMPSSRLPVFSNPYHDIEYLQWILAYNAITYCNFETFPGTGVLFIDGSYHAVLNGGDPADYICVDNPNLTETSLELAALYIGSDIPCQVINPGDVDDEHDPCWPTEEKGHYIRSAMVNGGNEVFAIGRRSLQHISPGDFLKTTRHDTDDWPNRGYVFNMFCCKTAADELEYYSFATRDALVMKWMLGNAEHFPSGGHAVSYLGCRHSGIIGEHIELATEFAKLRQDDSFTFHQEVLFQAIRNLAVARPYMINYLKQVVSFGWPIPTMMDSPVGIMGDDSGHKSGVILRDELHCHPNPFNPTLNLSLNIITDAPISVTVHDVSGRLVKSFPPISSRQSPHRFTWDGKDDSGANLGSGVYFIRAKTAGTTISEKVTLLK